MRFQARNAGPVKYVSISDWFSPRDRYTCVGRQRLSQPHGHHPAALPAPMDPDTQPAARPPPAPRKPVPG